MPLARSLDSLTEKERQTLRLIVKGHDAKSVARSLNLSVHTINERLRGARRKLSVSSSREAARLLLEAEAAAGNNSLVDQGMGEAFPTNATDDVMAPNGGATGATRPRTRIGVLLMSATLGLLAIFGSTLATAPVAIPTQQSPTDQAVVDFARQWLALVDRDDWSASYSQTGAAFRDQNTQAIWASTSDAMRARFGRLVSRSFLSQQDLPAPPAGYQVVKFNARYANKADAVETVTLERQDGAWRVVGFIIE